MLFQELVLRGLLNKAPIIGYRRSGAPIYAIMGGAPTSAEGGSEGGTEEETEEEETEEEESEEDSDKGDDDVAKASAKAKERMKAADRRASDAEKRAKAAEAKIKAVEDKDKTELERAQGRVTELETETKKLSDEVQRLRVHNAFFANNEVSWHDPADALGALDLSKVDITEDGVVDEDELKKAIKALAKKKPHWVKKDDGSSTEASGSTMNSTRKGGSSNQPDREKLLSDFPALNRRSV